MAPLSSDCFRRAEALERLSERIYQRLTHRFVEVPRAAAMFQRLAAEEVQHADRVSLLHDRFLHAPETFCDVADFPQQLQQLIEEGEVLLGMIEDQGATISLDEALSLTVEMERKFFVAHSEVVISDEFPEIKAFFHHLAQGDKEHRALLESIASPA